jgi:predicted DNA-binding protein (UPF0251 family)
VPPHEAIAPNLFELGPVEEVPAIATASASALQLVRQASHVSGTPKTRARKVEMEVRRGEVLRLRLAHVSEEEIGRQLGVSRATACRDLQAVRTQWSERFADFDPVAEVGEALALYELLEGATIRELMQLPDGATTSKLKCVLAAVATRRARIDLLELVGLMDRSLCPQASSLPTAQEIRRALELAGVNLNTLPLSAPTGDQTRVDLE